MQDQWYGDKGDVLKWSALIHLARRRKIERILHVAMYRQSSFPTMDTKDGPVCLPRSVLEHFRDVNDIQRLALSVGIEITVVLDEFMPKDREKYFRMVCTRIRCYDDQLIVLIDPDTGLEPKKAKAEHIGLEEIRCVFEQMRDGQLLVCYQHGNRHSRWREHARKRLACALGVELWAVEVLASEMAGDVIMLAAVQRQSGSDDDPWRSSAWSNVRVRLAVSPSLDPGACSRTPSRS